jgi:hypothetical protein
MCCSPEVKAGADTDIGGDPVSDVPLRACRSIVVVSLTSVGVVMTLFSVVVSLASVGVDLADRAAEE